MVRVIKVERSEDWKAYMGLRHHVFCVERDVPEALQVDEYDTLSGNCDHFLALDGEVPVGAFRCRREDGFVQLQRFCVWKEHRKNGIGRIMLEHARDYYGALGFEKICMVAKFSAKPFYERCGCVTTSQVFMEVGLPHVDMELQLDKQDHFGL